MVHFINCIRYNTVSTFCIKCVNKSTGTCFIAVKINIDDTSSEITFDHGVEKKVSNIISQVDIYDGGRVTTEKWTWVGLYIGSR